MTLGPELINSPELRQEIANIEKALYEKNRGRISFELTRVGITTLKESALGWRLNIRIESNAFNADAAHFYFEGVSEDAIYTQSTAVLKAWAQVYFASDQSILSSQLRKHPYQQESVKGSKRTR